MIVEPKTDAQKLARRNRELTILNEIASALNEEVDLGAALTTALDRVAALLELKTGWIWLFQDDGLQENYLAAAQNLPPALRDNPQHMEGDCYCLRTFRFGDLEGAANVNVVGCSRLSGLVDGTDGLGYHASVPLYASHGKKLGVLNVAGTEWRQLSAGDLRLLATIGDLLSIAIERARLFAGSRQMGALEERSRLAREIHDTLGQSLAAITLHMETADALFESGGDAVENSTASEIWAIVRKALELSRSSLQEARSAVLDLRAAPLEGRTLAEAIRVLLDEFQERTGLATHYHLVGEHQPLPLRLEVGVYRIAQEALANIEQHAQAGLVAIELVVTPGSLRLTVKDDGRGFRPDAIPQGHYGLIGMNERIHLMGGQMDLLSSPEAGTFLKVSIPLEQVS